MPGKAAKLATIRPSQKPWFVRMTPRLSECPQAVAKGTVSATQAGVRTPRKRGLGDGGGIGGANLLHRFVHREDLGEHRAQGLEGCLLSRGRPHRRPPLERRRGGGMTLPKTEELAKIALRGGTGTVQDRQPVTINWEHLPIIDSAAQPAHIAAATAVRSRRKASMLCNAFCPSAVSRLN